MVTSGESGTPMWIRTVLVGRNPKRTAVRVLVLIVVSVIVFRFVLLPIRVEGMSMMPTYKEHRPNVVNRLAYLFHPPQRGDVVAISTSGFSIMYMKRIIGLPGESVTFHHGQVFIDGKPLEEPYVKYPCDWEIAPRLLGAEEYYCVGDNRAMPARDHYKGVAPLRKIVGKVVL